MSGVYKSKKTPDNMAEYPQFDGLLLQMASQLGNAGAGGIEAVRTMPLFLQMRVFSSIIHPSSSLQTLTVQ